ncbi:MAG: bifunctional folylpolyglutamate synthase/dihydrofolate synthase [Acidobacteriota bacterium]|nr:bifunctional folylpolyglutamate synthase/dihydrofolate synthase [Acidobacteriota bacterium]
MQDSHPAEVMLSKLELFGMRLGLETTRKLLLECGDPQSRFATVLVGGTNGKGSVAAMLAATCSAAGYRTGLFTSPHLEVVTERLRVDGEPIGMDRLGVHLKTIVDLSKTMTGSPATYFESLFVSACLWFAQQECEVAVLEVGLGGRLDATNACEPAVSVITQIALEHQIHLGNSLASIAREKAGIMRHGRPVVVGERGSEARHDLEEQARRIGADWHWAPEEARILDRLDDSEWSRRLRLSSGWGDLVLRFELPGRHQESNLVTAVAAAEVLSRQGWGAIDASAFVSGVEKCRWPGRLERVELPNGAGLVVLDAAHNPSAARALAEFVRARMPEYVLLFGVLEDKEVAEMLPSLAAGASAVVLTRPTSSRGRSPEELEHLVPRDLAISAAAPGAALTRALEHRKPVLVCGSIYLVGEVRGELRRRFEVPSPA